MRVGTHFKQPKQPFEFEVPTDKFMVHFGYKDRSSIQVRLEQSGDVYASVFPEHVSYGAVSVTLPFDVFVDKFREFVRGLESLTKSPLGQLGMQADNE